MWTLRHSSISRSAWLFIYLLCVLCSAGVANAQTGTDEYRTGAVGFIWPSTGGGTNSTRLQLVWTHWTDGTWHAVAQQNATTGFSWPTVHYSIESIIQLTNDTHWTNTVTVAFVEVGSVPYSYSYTVFQNSPNASGQVPAAWDISMTDTTTHTFWAGQTYPGSASPTTLYFDWQTQFASSTPNTATTTPATTAPTTGPWNAMIDARVNANKLPGQSVWDHWKSQLTTAMTGTTYGSGASGNYANIFKWSGIGSTLSTTHSSGIFASISDIWGSIVTGIGVMLQKAHDALDVIGVRTLIQLILPCITFLWCAWSTWRSFLIGMGWVGVDK